MSCRFIEWLGTAIGFIRNDSIATHEQRIRKISSIEELRLREQAGTRHKLQRLEIEFSEQLKRVQAREAGVTRDYEEFLDQIDAMKARIVETFPDMPPVLALLIHQHAKQLVDAMWHESTEQSRQLSQARLTEFLKIVFDETRMVVMSQESSRLPEKTIACIEKHTSMELPRI